METRRKYNSADMTRANLVLSTIHGSRLYGLAHENSDNDRYYVFTGFPHQMAFQILEGNNSQFAQEFRKALPSLGEENCRANEDRFVVSLDAFMKMCDDGIPQALEAMFSPTASCNPMMDAYRNSYHAPVRAMRMKYRHAIEKFMTMDSFKGRRHAMRLALNLRQAEANNGRFCPTLTPEQKEFAGSAAMLPDADYQNALEETMNGGLFN